MRHSIIKQTIIETASQLFYKNGYNLTGINEIIAEAGIAKATLYSHFKSKEDICIAYLRHMNDTFIEDIEVFCRKKSKGKNQVLAIFDFLSIFFKDEAFNGCWCIKTVSEIPKENEKVKTVIRAQKNTFIETIKNLITDNQVRTAKKEIDILAKQIYLLYESAVSESHLHGEDWPIKSTKLIAKQLIE